MQIRFLSLLILVSVFSSANAQLNAEVVGQLSYGDNLSNLWGWTDPDGNEYVVLGTFDGVSIVDISNPADPFEIQFIDRPNSTWRQMGVWDDYAYVVNESGGGLLSINLGTIPATGEAEFNETDGNVALETGHILYVDENGIIYVFGPNIYGGSTVMFDAPSSPMDPQFMGATDTWYVHHGYAENDTLWECNIYQGWFSVWDVTDKTSPELLATQGTPGSFTHNAILMDNGVDLHTTDEVTNGSLASYDVSDLGDIDFKGEFRPTPGTNSIPHYAWDLDHYVLTAWYRDGLVVTDMTYPEAAIMTAWYDTSPLSGNGFNGAWGVYPYFPSGVIAVSDIEEGLFLIDVDFVEAAFLKGIVTDASTTAPIFDATVSVSPDPSLNTNSDIIGNYITGTATAGTFDITYSRPGYNSYTETGVELINGETVTLDVELEPLASFPFTGQVVDVVSGEGIEGADVLISNPDVEFTAVTDADGNFIIPSLFDGTYSIYAGHWGHVTDVVADLDINDGVTVVVELNRGYYDDFLFDFDWTTTSDAGSGDWVKADPIGTEYGAGLASPEDDIDDDYGIECYTTGNGGGSGGTDDIDDGIVELITPVFDLTGYANPYVSYYRWFFNNGGAGTSPDDSLVVEISNGIETVELTFEEGFTTFGFWIPEEFKISDYITPTANMQMTLGAGDYFEGHIVEAAIDVFYVFDSLTTAPTAAFDAVDEGICAGSTASFIDMSIEASTWEWSFPGGSPATSTIANPLVTYSTPGIYDVSLTVTNPLGSNTTTLSDFITVYEVPEVVVSAGAGSSTATVTGGAEPYEYLWSDGQTESTAVGLSVGSYSVTIIDANGCEAFAEVQVTSPSSITVFEDGLQIELFPNPVVDQLNISVVNEVADSYIVDIVDVTGKLTQSFTVNNGINTIDCSKLSAGIYTVRFTNESSIAATVTFVKQ